jgi:glucosyl-dolichyl phosphate glucuronosyltransferase
MIKASIIVCTFNRCDSLAQVLESLLRMAVPAEMAWEILIVDNNSRDATKSVAESFVAHHPKRIRYVFEGKQGKSFALNTAIQEARGEILAFTDDDVTCDPHWLAELVAAMEKFSSCGVGGKIIPVWSVPKPSWFEDTGPHRISPAIVNFDFGDQPAQLNVAPFGANVAFRRTVFQKYGGFRTDLGLTAETRIGAEDTEFCRRLMKAGEVLYYVPEAIIYHPVEKSRTVKSYFEGWYLSRGKAFVREESIPEDAMRYLGVPRYLLGNLFRSAVKWFSSLSPKRRFYYKLEVYETIGRIQEARARAVAHR